MDLPEKVQIIVMHNKIVNFEEGHVHLNNIEVQMGHVVDSPVKVQQIMK